MANPNHAAIYCRISKDKAGHELGVLRQEDDCRSLASCLGWSVGNVYTDNDISAYKGRSRPGYLAMLKDVRAGKVDGLLTWHTDRLTRRQDELENLIDTLGDVPVQTVTAGTIDLATASGRMTARILGAVARQESEHKAERLKAKHAELARNGQPVGPRSFGYSDVLRRLDGTTYRVEVPEEAELLRKAAQEILAGGTLRGICRRWNEEGIKSSIGGPWRTKNLLTVLTKETIVGRRHGKPAQWPAILDENTYKTLKALATSRKRGRSFPRNLLSGIATCTLCGRPLVHRPIHRPTGNVKAYHCNADSGGCGRVHIAAAPFEQDVIDRLFSRYDATSVVAPDADENDPALDELSRLEGVKANISQLFGSGDMDLDDYRTAKTANDARIAELSDAIAARAAKQAEDQARVQALDLYNRWDELTTEERRRVITATARTITVGPTTKPGYAGYQPERVTVIPQ